MKAEELDKQFQAMENDSQVQAAAAGTPPAPPVRRRVTTADLKKRIDSLENDIEKDVLDWLGNLDTRLESLEATTAKHNDTLLSDVKTRLDILERFRTEDLPMVVTNVNEKIKAMETAIGALADAVRQIGEGTALWGSRIEEAEDLTNEMMRHQLQPQETPLKPEIEFAKPPTATPDQLTQAGEIAAVASVCLTMNDVLMITRALKDATGLPDLQRVEILNIACRSAGVEYTDGLRIRAGVKYLEA